VGDLNNTKILLKKSACEPPDDMVPYYIYKGGINTEMCSISSGSNISPYSEYLIFESFEGSSGRKNMTALGFRCVYVE
jgi:hypothetical protein